MATPIPQNQASFSLAEILSATRGTLVHSGTAAARGVEGICTDTRAELRGKAFVALIGERFDGHDHLQQAAHGGATVLLVERDVPVAALSAVSVVRVASTLGALGDLARFHRRRWDGRVVAIAGSAGKTTTRSAVSSTLEALLPGRVCSTRGNLNNRIGLPLTLLGVTDEHDVCVLEIGTNQTGEVAELASVCEPNVALLTLIDLEHSEGLGSLDAIEREEGALFAAVPPAGTIIGNGDDERVRRQMQGAPAQVKLTYGVAKDASYRIAVREPRGPEGSRVVIQRTLGEIASHVEFDCPLLGEPGALAAAAALAVAEVIVGKPLDGAVLGRALQGAGETGRLRIVRLASGAWVLDDTYNSNPASVLASIQTARELAERRGGAFWLVLGEMRELGNASADEHMKMGEGAARSGASGLFAVSGEARRTAEAAERSGMKTWFFEDAAEVARPLAALLGDKDVAVVKASRGVRAERVVEGLVALCGRAQ